MRWTIEFDATGLPPGEARMVAAVVEGNLRMLCLAFPALGTPGGEDPDRANAERACELVAAQLPHITFRVVATGEGDTSARRSRA